MSGRLSSPRFRRRLAKAGGLGLVAAGAAVLAVAFWDTGRSVDRPLSTEPAIVPEQRDNVALAEAEERQAIATAAKFVDTAVRRERVADSYDLVSPALRQGLTREEWAKGAIPVQPYPVDAARWKLDYSYADELGLQVYVVPDAGERLRPMVFLLSMTKDNSGRWVVASWVPRPGAGGGPPAGATSAGPGTAEPSAAPAVVDAPKGRISGIWLLVPAFVLGGVVAVGVGKVVRDRRATRRAERAYAEDQARRATGSSSPS